MQPGSTHATNCSPGAMMHSKLTERNPKFIFEFLGDGFKCAEYSKSCGALLNVDIHLNSTFGNLGPALTVGTLIGRCWSPLQMNLQRFWAWIHRIKSFHQVCTVAINTPILCTTLLELPMFIVSVC